MDSTKQETTYEDGKKPVEEKFSRESQLKRSNWEEKFPILLAQQFQLLLCNTPWRITFKNGENIDEKAQARWDLIAAKSDWDRFSRKIVQKLSLEGNVATPINIGEDGIPYFSIAERIVRWDKLVAQKFVYIGVIQRWDHSIYPRYIYTEYQRNQNINQMILKDTKGNAKFTKEGSPHIDTSVVFHNVVHNFNQVTCVWWINRIKGSETNLGYSDTDNVKNELRKMDIINDKIEDEILFASTEIASYANEGSFMETMLNPEQKKEKHLQVRENFAKNVRHYEIETDNQDNKQFYVRQKEAKVQGMRQELNELLMHVIFQTGGILFKDRSGIVQITNSQSLLAKSTSVLVSNEKRNQLEEHIRELISIIIKIDEKEHWDTFTSLDVDIFVSDPMEEKEMKDNPEKFLMLGYTIERMIALIQKIPVHEAVEYKNRVTETLMKDPLTNFMVFKDVNMVSALINNQNEQIGDKIAKAQLDANTFSYAKVETKETKEKQEELENDPEIEIKDEGIDKETAKKTRNLGRT